MPNPQLPDEKTKFEVRGFNKEPEAAETEVEVSAEDADKLAAQIQGGPQDMTFEDPNDPGPEVIAEETPAPQAAAPAAPAKSASIRIMDKEFANQEEAFAYANELAQKELINDAFRHGLETAQRAQPGNPEPQVQPQEEEIPPDIMYDPKLLAKYITDKASAAKEAAKLELNQQTEIKRRNDETWNKFYSDFPDLLHAQDLVQVELNKNWNTLAHMDTAPALKILAEKVRGRVQKIVEGKLPGQELSQVKRTASPGNHTEVTRQPKEEKSLSFVEQMKNARKKRTAPPRR